MSRFVRIALGLVIVASAADTLQAAAQRNNAPAGRPRAVLTLPVIGTFASGGEFSGTISINRFERRGEDVVAIGMVAGVLSRGPLALGTAVAGEVAWTVRVSTGGSSLVNGPGSAPGRLTRVAWSPDMPGNARLLRVQA